MSCHCVRSASARVVWLAVSWLAGIGELRAAEPLAPVGLAAKLRALPANVFSGDAARAARRSLPRQLAARLAAANRESSRNWSQLSSRAEWEAFRDARLQALRAALSLSSDSMPAAVQVRRTGSTSGDGFSVENLLFESRPGLWVSANLYRPLQPAASHPAILISHSHHSPKSQSELQTMGMTWARQGAYVLVPDHVGHGERRQHPFASDKDFPQPFKPSRQDYYFRYDTSLQLYLVGESLMGWMAADLSRSLDVLLAQPGVNREQTIILGGVAGGGDPAAVAAAVDERFAAAGVFNFGGPQPESRFPLPDDSDQTFDFAGSGSWESTRNLHRSAVDGFLPWVIVASLAPRRLIYGHEFSWDRAHDPVWKRLERIYGWYDADAHLAFAHGAGRLSGQPPEATHCNVIGAPHRRMIYPALERWFGMPDDSQREYDKPLSARDLRCWTGELQQQLQPLLVHQWAARLARRQIAAARDRLHGLAPHERRAALRKSWREVLGAVEPRETVGIVRGTPVAAADAATAERLACELTDGVSLPLLLLLPRTASPPPVVVALAQQGKQALLAGRSGLIAELLGRGVGVCLIDVRGVGELAPEDSGRDRTSTASDLSASELMLGTPHLGEQLRDLVTVVQALRKLPSVDGTRIGVWGDSLADFNPPSRLIVPHGVDGRPVQLEPLGGLAAALAALFDESLRMVYARRGLVSYASALASPAVPLPHDAVVPGVIKTGDLPLLHRELAARLRIEQPLDAQNIPLADPALAELSGDESAHTATARPTWVVTATDDVAQAEWMAGLLRK